MISAVIIENEAQAANYLGELLKEHCKDVSVGGTYTTISAAVEAISNTHPQLVFLDIELDNESGIDLFKYFPEPSFEVVFTTAHNDYALKAIKLSCLEYLLKPVTAGELIAAVDKFRRKGKALANAKNLEAFFYNMTNAVMPNVCIPTEEGYTFLNKSDIIMCEASGNYTDIYTAGNKKVLCSKNIGTIEDMLNDVHFFRCHKSWLVNLTHIRQYRKTESELWLSGDLKAQVAARKKDELLKVLTVG